MNDTESSDSDAFVDTQPLQATRTRSGRKSQPVQEEQFLYLQKKERKTKFKEMEKQAGGSQQPPVVMSPEQLQQLLAGPHPRQRGTGNMTTLFEGSSLPKFRGRRREKDPVFVQSQSFADYIKLVNAHIDNNMPSATDAEKKNLLLITADKNVGDFYDNVGYLINSEAMRGKTYEDLIGIFRDMYCSLYDGTVYDSATQLKKESQEKLNHRGQIGKKITSYAEKAETFINFHMERSVGDSMIEQYDREDDDDYRIRYKCYIKELLRDYTFKLLMSDQFSSQMQPKLFEKTERTFADTITKVFRVVRETPTNVKVLRNEQLADDPYKAQRNIEVYNIEEEKEDYSEDIVDEDINVFYSSQRGRQPRRGRGIGRATYRGGRSTFRDYGSRRGTPFNKRSGTNRYHGREPGYHSGYEPDEEVYYGQPEFKGDPRSSYHQERKRNVSCFNCGKTGHYASECRGKKLINCYLCGKQGHYANECKDKKVVKQEEKKPEAFLGGTNSEERRN